METKLQPHPQTRAAHLGPRTLCLTFITCSSSRSSSSTSTLRGKNTRTEKVFSDFSFYFYPPRNSIFFKGIRVHCLRLSERGYQQGQPPGPCRAVWATLGFKPQVTQDKVGMTPMRGWMWEEAKHILWVRTRGRVLRGWYLRTQGIEATEAKLQDQGPGWTLRGTFWLNTDKLHSSSLPCSPGAPRQGAEEQASNPGMGRKAHGALAAPVSPEQDGVWTAAWHLSPGWGHKCLGQVLKPVAQGRPLSTNTEKPQGQAASPVNSTK